MLSALKPRGHTIPLLIREAAIGSALGLAGSFGWYFGVQRPQAARMAAIRNGAK